VEDLKVTSDDPHGSSVAVSEETRSGFGRATNEMLLGFLVDVASNRYSPRWPSASSASSASPVSQLTKGLQTGNLHGSRFRI